MGQSAHTPAPRLTDIALNNETLWLIDLPGPVPEMATAQMNWGVNGATTACLV